MCDKECGQEVGLAPGWLGTVYKVTPKQGD